MKRIGVMLILVVLCISMLLPMTVSAYEVNTQPVSSGSVSWTASEPSISPRADVIVVKFRVYNGVLQFRRWNETWGYWVDPYWMVVV